MNRLLSRNWGRAAWTFVWLLLGSGALAQVPEQHWQPTPNSQSDPPPSYPPNYQPSTGATVVPRTGNPATGVPVAGPIQYPQRPDQPVGPPQYPTIERREPAPAGQPTSGQPIQGPAAQNIAPQAPFVLSPPEAAALDNLLTDWEKRNKEIHVLESKFYRWKYDNVFGNVNQAPPPPEEGVLKFAAPDKGLMKIEAKDPKQSEQWLCDGKSIYQFNYSEHMVTEYVMPAELQGRGIRNGPLPFVFGVEAQELKQRYFMRIITPPNVQNEVWLEAYPRYQQQAAEFSKVQVILQISGSTRALLPFAIQIYSPNGKDRTVYQLQDPSINPRGGWIPVIGGDWWKPSIPFTWKKKTELPPPPIQAGLSPAMSSRR